MYEKGKPLSKARSPWREMMMALLPSSVVTYAAAPQPKIRILHETERYAVVAKPAGCVVHRNKYSPDGEVPLLQRVRDQLGRHVHAVHRLDGGTSGCVVFAFDSPTTSLLQEAMTSGTARKTYLAMVRGNASRIRDQVVDRPIKDDEGIQRAARTHLDCVASCEDELAVRSSLIVASPSTGRWHQIRKHCNGLSHPILGDAKHGDSRVNRWWREQHELRGLGLHCHSLELHLADGDSMSVRCPVRPDLVAVWRGLPWWDDACAALPTLCEDAELADHALALEAAAQDPFERAAAAGRGQTTFFRRTALKGEDGARVRRSERERSGLRYFMGYSSSGRAQTTSQAPGLLRSAADVTSVSSSTKAATAS